jgi:hypothetical protein
METDALDNSEPAAATSQDDPSDESGNAADGGDSAEREAPDTDDAADDADGADSAEDEDGDSSDAVGAADIGRQIVDGDLAGACKLLGIDPKILNVNVPKFEAMRKGLKESRAREAAAVAAETEAKKAQDHADAVMADAKSKYGDLVDLKLSVKAGDYYAVREILEALAPEGTPIKTVLEGIALAAKNVSPSEIAYKRKLREIAAKEQADKEAAKEAEKTTNAAKEQAAVAERNKAGAEKLLKGSAFEGIPGAADALVKLAADNWDPVKKGLKLPKEQLVRLLAKDPVIGQLAELKRLKGKPAAPPAPPANKNKNRSASGQFARPPAGKGPSKAEKEEAERKASIAEAARLEARDARAARRAK